MKTVALEEIYADPRKLGALLDAGEAVAVMRDGEPVADLLPRGQMVTASKPGAATDFRERFLRMWGADALESRVPVAELFDELRRPRTL